MALADVEVLATDPAFVSRVKAAIVQQATQTLATAATTEQEQKNQRYAGAVLHQPDRNAAEMAYGVASNATVLASGNNSTDDLIIAVVAALWPAYASSY